MSEKYVCYLCAYTGELYKFRIKKPSGGFSRKQFLCPDCGRRMRRRSLLMNISPYDWGALIYCMIRIYRRKGEEFYYRVSFDKLIKRLPTLNCSRDFWSGYKDAKEWGYQKRVNHIDKIYMPPNPQTKLV